MSASVLQAPPAECVSCWAEPKAERSPVTLAGGRTPCGLRASGSVLPSHALFTLYSLHFCPVLSLAFSLVTYFAAASSCWHSLLPLSADFLISLFLSSMGRSRVGWGGEVRREDANWKEIMFLEN